jgi:ferredoxin--NADP+ reductase
MENINIERVTSVKHWSHRMFSFTTTRSQDFRFESGQFVMIGIRINGQPVLRPYSIVSPSHSDQLEFLSIIVPEGKLTPHLANIKVGDEITVKKKSAGTLVPGYLSPGKNLILLCTGTGIAPFMSIAQDPYTYDSFEKVILVHSVREQNDLAYFEELSSGFENLEYIGEIVKDKFSYHPIVTGPQLLQPRYSTAKTKPQVGKRITSLLADKELFDVLGIDQHTSECRFMICGNTEMAKESIFLLEKMGFKPASSRVRGDYTTEHAFLGIEF